jgi:hypothetical protein
MNNSFSLATMSHENQLPQPLLVKEGSFIVPPLAKGRLGGVIFVGVFI